MKVLDLGSLRISYQMATIFLLLCLSVISTMVAADIQSGISWIAAQQHPDGSVGLDSDISTRYQSTSEVIRTFSAIQQSLPNAASADAYVAGEKYTGTSYLHRMMHPPCGKRTSGW